MWIFVSKVLSMWPFSSKTSLLRSGVLNGWTDWHSHILPGVDDGIRTLDDSLAVLRWYEIQGVREVWLTPHIMEDIPNSPADLRARYAELQAAYEGPIVLHLAAEHMLDPLFAKRLAADDVLPLCHAGAQGAEAGAYLLVETSYFNPPMDLDGMLDSIKAKGYRPLLAHPERYVYMDKADILRLAGRGIAFQLNLPSLVGVYGEGIRRKAEAMLRAGLFVRCGSDLHDLGHFQAAAAERVVSSRLLAQLPR